MSRRGALLALVAALLFGASAPVASELVGDTGPLALAGGLLVWEPGASSIDTGALLVIGACVAWGVDDGLTARIERFTPEAVVLAKGLVAGSANLVLGLASGERLGDAPTGIGTITWRCSTTTPIATTSITCTMTAAPAVTRTGERSVKVTRWGAETLLRDRDPVCRPRSPTAALHL